MPALLALWLQAAPAWAGPVLIPEATPASSDDFGVAYLMYGLVVDAVRGAGLDVKDGDGIRGEVGGVGDLCMENPACPGKLLSTTDGSVVVVLGVAASGEGVAVEVRIYTRNGQAPVRKERTIVAPGDEQAYANTVAGWVKEASSSSVTTITPIGPKVIITPIEPEPPVKEPQEPEEPPVKEPEEPEEPPVKTPKDPPPPPPKISAARLREEALLVRQVPPTVYNRYKESGLTPSEFRDEARIRAGRAYLAMGGGLGVGDVSRYYGTRVRIARNEDGSDFVRASSSTIESTASGQGATGALTIGYAPVWFVDTGISVGFQYGQKTLDTGWECLPADCTEPPNQGVDTHTPVPAFQAVIEPRVRFVPVPSGVLKPYVLTAFTLLIHDGFEAPDLQYVDYPDSTPGTVFGPTVGGGFFIDALPSTSLFFEVPFTFLQVSPLLQEQDAADVQAQPPTVEQSGRFFRVVAGIEVRL